MCNQVRFGKKSAQCRLLHEHLRAHLLVNVRRQQVPVQQRELFEAVQERRRRQLKLGLGEVHEAVKPRLNFTAARVLADSDVCLVSDL